MNSELDIQQNIALAPCTTLGVGGFAEYYVEVRNEQELEQAVSYAETKNIPLTVLGEGSNVLVADEGVKGLVIRPFFTQKIYEETPDGVRADVGAGVTLDDFVADAVSRNLWGVENLSGIPGTVGATPVQNVGAYGVEVSDIIISVRVYNMQTKKFFEIKNSECNFLYRDSRFKKEKNIIITHVSFLLQKNSQPQISYKDIAEYFSQNTSPALQEIRNAILDIRSKKFPDWTVEGTAGSFFKNPIITQDAYNTLLLEYPDIPGYILDSGEVKVSLGWILDKVCNLKGFREGNIRLYEKQALVLVCKKGISADEIKNFSKKISQKVFEKTKIKIENEVTFLF